MTGTLAVIFGLIVIIVAVTLLIKRYDTCTVLLGAGILMALVAFKPLEAFQGFTKAMTNGGLIQNICSVMGFAFVMRVTSCDKHLIFLLAKGLSKIRPVLIPGAAIMTYVINISLTSAAGAAAAVGSILIPLLISAGVAPAIAASAVMLGTFGSLLSPGSAHQPIIAALANIEVIEVIKTHALADFIALLIGVVSLTIVAKVLKEDKGYVDPDNVTADLSFKVNPVYAILPLLPVILLVIFSLGDVRAALPWAKQFNVPTAMLIGSILCFSFTRTSPSIASKSFFEGMGKGYGEIMGIIISAGVFVAGMKSLGLIDAGIEALKGSTGIIPVATAFGPFLLGLLSGSGDAAAIAFNESVTVHAAEFGFDPARMGSLAALAGALGRTMSPIAGAAIICASLAKVSPFEIPKRNGPGMIIATIVIMFVLMYTTAGFAS